MQVLMEPIHASRALLGFSGWPDAGKLVHHTLGEIKRAISSEHAAIWDMDGFWHTESSRPHALIEHGHLQRFEWPSYRFFLCRPDGPPPLLIGMGPEPGCNWRTFARQMLLHLRQWGCEEIFLLGSLHDQIFHDEILISSVVQDPHGMNLAHELGCRPSHYRGPAAIHGAVMEEARQRSVFSMSFWAHLPFYLDGPHELVIAELLNIVGRLTGLPLGTQHLVESWKDREKEIESAIEGDPELRQMIETLDKETLPRKRGASSPSKVIQFADFLKRKHEPDPQPQEPA